MAFQTYVSHPLSAGDIAGAGFTVTAAGLASNSYLFRAKLMRGQVASAYSASVAAIVTQPPNAPTLTLLSTSMDTTPDFTITLPTGFGDDRDARVNDIVNGQYSSNGGANWSAAFSHTLIAGDVAAGNFAATSTQLFVGTYLFRARLERATVASAWSANVSDQIGPGSSVPTNMYVRSAANKSEAIVGGNDINTVLLLHCDGTNNSTTFTDIARGHSVVHPVTANGNAKLITATKKFGSAAASFDATANTQISLDGNTDFAFAPGVDFTVDFQVYFISNVGINTLCDFRGVGNQGYCITIYVDVNGQIFFNSNGTNFISGTTIISGSAWYHVALTRAGTNTRLFLNGVQEGATYTGDTVNYPVGVNRPCFGGNGNDPTIPATLFNGLLDEIRVSKGIARWTANFTPPAAQYYSTENARLRAQTDKGLI